MATTNTQFAIRHWEQFGGNFVDSDYLAASYDTAKPHVFEDTMVKLFTSSDRFSGKTLLGMLAGNVKEIDNEIYRWYAKGTEEKVLRSMGNPNPSNLTPGIGRTSFQIRLDEDWVRQPDVLMGEDNEYALEIIDGPYFDAGSNSYLYTVRLQTNDNSKFFPPSLLDADRAFSKVWTTVQNEMNDQFGTMQFGGSFMMESRISFFAQKLSVTDKALRDQGRISTKFSYKDSKGRETSTTKFMPAAEAKMWDALYSGVDAQLTYGESSLSVGPDGYVKPTGPGIRQILRDGHIAYYNGALQEEFLIDYLMDIFFSRVDEGNRKVTLMTGTGGAITFHNMLAAQSRSFLQVDNNWIQRIGSSPRHLSYGAQFTHYQGPEGIEVTLVKNPMYDSTKYCKRMHPDYPDRPIDSYRFTCLDFGMSDGEANIQLLRQKDTFRYGYSHGTVGPNGPIKGGAVSALKAHCEWFAETSAGVWMKDPTRGGELIFDFED